MHLRIHLHRNPPFFFETYTFKFQNLYGVFGACVEWRTSVTFRFSFHATSYDPSHDKTNKMMCTQWRLRSAWASAQSDQSSLSAWLNTGSWSNHWAYSKDSSQSAPPPPTNKISKFPRKSINKKKKEKNAGLTFLIGATHHTKLRVKIVYAKIEFLRSVRVIFPVITLIQTSVSA